MSRPHFDERRGAYWGDVPLRTEEDGQEPAPLDPYEDRDRCGQGEWIVRDRSSANIRSKQGQKRRIRVHQ